MSESFESAIGNSISPQAPLKWDELVSALRARVGDPFVDWFLPSSTEGPTGDQTASVLLLTREIAEHSSKFPSLPVRSSLSRFIYHWPNLGTSPINHLRKLNYCEDLPAFDTSGDATLDALTELAVESYGELLLSVRDPFVGPSGGINSPQIRRFLDALYADEEVPYTSRQDSITFASTAGQINQIQAVFVATSTIGATWHELRLDHAVPSLQQLVDALPQSLEKALKAVRGWKVRVPGIVSFTGVTMPEGKVIEFPWGKIRPARPDDHPEVVDYLKERATEGDGAVRITDAGEVLLHVDLPFRLFRAPTEFDHVELYKKTPRFTSENLTLRITQVMLSLILSTRAQPPVVYAAWSRIIPPISQGGSVGLSDPGTYAMRIPTALTAEAVDEWKSWLGRLDKADLSKFGVAPSRLLRAAAERRDPSDALIDSVICWEALLGGPAELTYRISVAMAKLLRPPGPERKDLRQEIAKLYQLRSHIVHGLQVEQETLYQKSQQALGYAIDLFRVLVSERTDLINMTSSERSVTVAME